MVILLILATHFTAPINGYKFTEEKLANSLMGAGAAAVVYSYVEWTQENPSAREKITMSIAGAVIMGYIKEGTDLQHNRDGGIADIYDWGYTIVGGVIGAALAHWIYRQGYQNFEYEVYEAIKETRRRNQ